MTQIESKGQGFLKRHKTALQTIAFVLILVLPFVLYAFAQAGQAGMVTALLILMTLVMLGIIMIS
jgi:hypothetical protein